MSDDDARIRETIERFIARRFARDAGLADEFEADAILAGSGDGQLHFGGREIAEHFEAAASAPFTLRHDWTRLEIRRNGDTAWFFAHGNAMIGRDGTETPLPVRISGVLVEHDEEWRYQLLHVSEPA